MDRHAGTAIDLVQALEKLSKTRGNVRSSYLTVLFYSANHVNLSASVHVFWEKSLEVQESFSFKQLLSSHGLFG